MVWAPGPLSLHPLPGFLPGAGVSPPVVVVFLLATTNLLRPVSVACQAVVTPVWALTEYSVILNIPATCSNITHVFITDLVLVVPVLPVPRWSVPATTTVEDSGRVGWSAIFTCYIGLGLSPWYPWLAHIYILCCLVWTFRLYDQHQQAIKPLPVVVVLVIPISVPSVPLWSGASPAVTSAIISPR